MAPERVRRFTATERAFHWAHAGAFLVMLATGLTLYLPALAIAVGRRPTVKGVHLTAAVVWVIALVAICLLGNRRALADTWRDAERLDAHDRRWLRRRRPAEPGRFNAGQKLNVMASAGLAVVFLATGAVMWLGERDHRFLIPGAGIVHNLAMFAAIPLLVGHLYLALVHPPTRHAMRGMITGWVDAAWAVRHHPRWRPDRKG